MLSRIKTRCGYCLLLACLFLVSATVTADPFDLEISKSDRILKVKKGDQVIKLYHIAFGKGGKGSKREVGDNKTPVGSYRILGFKSDSKFYYFMQLNYPNLVDAWHGYKERLISAREFKKIAVAYHDGDMPPQNTMLGGYIGIHGIGDITRKKLHIHSAFNWTDGCIALKNDEINELRRYVSIGTRVVISE